MEATPFTGEIGQVVYGVFQVSPYSWVVVRQETVALNGSPQGAHQFAANANTTLKLEAERAED